MSTTTSRPGIPAPQAELNNVIASSQLVGTPYFKLPTHPAAIVLRSIRLAGIIYRDQIAVDTGLSAATVNRQVSALLESGIISERTDQLNSGSVGRPRMPVELNATGPLAIAVNIGENSSTISIYDTLIRLIHVTQIPHSDKSATNISRSISDAINNLTTRWKSRTFLRIGVTIAGSVNKHHKVDHPQLGWKESSIAELIASQTGFRVTVSPLVEAMAATELQYLSGHEATETTLYFYSHDTVGTAIIVGGAVRTARTGHSTLGQLPYSLLPKITDNPPTLLDPHGKGKIEDAVTQESIVEAARHQGLAIKNIDALVKLAAQGNDTAKAIFQERAAVLGAAVSLVSDIVNPDRIVLGGQGFTDTPQFLPQVAREIASRTIGVRRPVHITSAKQYVQQHASGAVALDRLFYDPIAEITSGKIRKYVANKQEEIS